MLTIRDAQLQAFADDDRLDMRRTVVDILLHRHGAALTNAPDGYVDDLASRAMTACAASGLDRRDAVIEFADALVKDDQHPLPPSALDAKTGQVVRECRSRELFNRLRAMADARGDAAGAPEGAPEGADDANEAANEEA